MAIKGTITSRYYWTRCWKRNHSHSRNLLQSRERFLPPMFMFPWKDESWIDAQCCPCLPGGCMQWFPSDDIQPFSFANRNDFCFEMKMKSFSVYFVEFVQWVHGTDKFLDMCTGIIRNKLKHTRVRSFFSGVICHETIAGAMETFKSNEIKLFHKDFKRSAKFFVSNKGRGFTPLLFSRRQFHLLFRRWSSL